MSEHRHLVAPAQNEATLTKRNPLVIGTLFGLTLVLAGAAYVSGLRAYLGSDSFAVAPIVYARAAVFAFAVLLWPFAVSDRYRPLGIALVFSLLQGLAFLPDTALILVEIVAMILVIIGLYRFARFARFVSPKLVLGVVGLAFFAGAFLGEINLRHNYSIPVGLEAALLGMTHQDTLFHAALAQNLLHASTVSIGADGLVPLVYHVFSHRVIGGFVTLVGTEVLHGYAIFLSIIAIPVLIGLLLQTAAILYQPAQIRLDPTVAMFSVLAWLVFGGALMWHSYYSSESYTLSLWFVLFVVLLLHHAATREVKGFERLGVIVLLALGVGLAALTKVSVGAVLACAVAAGLVIEGRFRPTAWASAILAGLSPAIFVYIAYPVTQDSSAALIKPFAFLRYTKPAVYAILFASIVSFLAWRHFPRDHATRTLTIALGAGLWAGLGASFLINTAAGAQYYFSDPGSWLGLMIIPLLGLAPKWLTRRGPSAQFGIVAAFIGVMLFMHDDNLRGLDRLESLHAAMSRLPDANTLGERAVQHTATGQAFQIARDRAEPYDAIFVDGAHTAFWKGQTVCWATSFILPSLVGKPMLNGIIPEGFGCEISKYYGFADYDLRSGRALAGATGLDVCAKANAKGLDRVLVITAESAATLSCAP
jgi:hypothetical protein